MPGPKLPGGEVTAGERGELERLILRHTTGQQRVERARLVVLMADGRSNSEAARVMGIDVDTARKWRRRWQRVRDVPLAEFGVTARHRRADLPAPRRAPSERGLRPDLNVRHALSELHLSCVRATRRATPELSVARSEIGRLDPIARL